MVAEAEGDYYRRRENLQCELAARAIDPGVAHIHLDLADRYRERVSRPSLRLVADRAG